MINLVIAYSQQKNNKCKEGDTEQDHMHYIADALFDILSKDKRLNTYFIPLQNIGTDNGNLKASIRLSNAFIKANGGKGYHIELHSDAGAYAKGCSALYVSEKGKILATYLYNELADLTPTPDAGVRKRDNLGALNQTIAVATILEVSFHDNQQEAKFIHDESISIAVRLANGIYKFLKGEKLI
jgi:N-acetylmuramoyl-L-alanine amidase